MIAEEMALLLKRIAHCGGFVITVVMDGTSRPDCKRASWDQKKEGSLTNINRMYCRFKMLKLSSRLEKEEMDEKKRATIKNELHAYNQAAKSLEKKCGRVAVSKKFCDHLLHRLRLKDAFLVNENGGFVSQKLFYQSSRLIMS